MKQIESKAAVYNDDETECLEIGWYEYDFIEPFKKTCSKVPSKLPKHIKSLGSAFAHNKSIKISGLENWNIINVYDVDFMFYECINLTTLDLSKWNNYSLYSIESMFSGCEKLIKLDIFELDPDDFNSMFEGCKELKVNNFLMEII